MTLPQGLASRLQWIDPDVALVPATARWPSAHGLLLRDGTQWTLVDAGGDRDLLEALAPHVGRVILSHYHLDHVLHNDLFPLSKVWANAADLQGYRSAQDYFAWSGAPQIPGERMRDFAHDRYRWLPDVRETFRPGDTLETTATRWRFVPVPGHSPGHVALYEPDRQYLHGVDVEFSGLGPWYGWNHCDADQFEAGVASLLKLPRRVVTTGHSPLIRGDGEKELRGFHDAFRDRDEQVVAFVASRKRATLDEIVEGVRIFYGRTLDKSPWLRPWCATMTRQHLSRLERARRVVRDGEDGWASV
ncbi:MAG TPA: MBL fold metallo-hydrolase [Candidatus Thermoplasmatota archaeon]|nr:MBL fold metallo-hydrolase [Candidatus Thermoplasmatota archaeon]